MTFDLSLLDEAEVRGYIEFDQNRTRITYHCGRQYTDDFNNPEEVVRAFVYSWLIINKGYPVNRIEVEHTVPRRQPSDRADIVLFSDDARSNPYLVVEVKQERCSQIQWQQAIEQGFGNANSLRTTNYLLIDKGQESILFDIQGYPPIERQLNRLGDRNALAANYGIAQQFRLIAGGSLDIRPIEPRTLETRVRRAHAAIWAGGRRDPLTAFDEWDKLLFAKIWDERHTPTGEPRDFQRSANETEVQTANRIRNRFREARRGDPSIFTDERINLPDDKISEVVQIIEDIGFVLCDIDALGSAFEHFFSSVFRGDLGQYFTRRELVRFVCGILQPTDTDYILDPTAGSGGFLLEALMDVWHHIDDNYSGQPEAERRKIDFALHNLYGIEIHSTLSRVCKTNLLIHKDGHTNIDGERSCLDSTFAIANIRPDASIFSIVVGNPPFGDEVREGDRDRLGNGSLSCFEISRGLNQISSELVIIERGLQFLVPGGRLGMVVPDGCLNNSGENSRCPAFRRLILRHAKIDMIVSLPDYAFRKAGAQNKTSLLFLRKYTTSEKSTFDHYYNEYLNQLGIENMPTVEQEKDALRHALSRNPYHVFIAEVERIGYTPAGAISSQNQLYTLNSASILDEDNVHTVYCQYNRFIQSPETYTASSDLPCRSVSILDILDAHHSYRLDPKFHMFQLEQVQAPPANMTEYILGDILKRREELVDPSQYPDEEFLTLTLSQDGTLSPREAGKGKNPPSWHGAYFTNGSRWYRAYAGDVIISQIDLWKGCASVVPEEYDHAIVTQEFPLYRVDTNYLDPSYLALLLRSEYFQRAIRAITTGHSNRRRTQSDDFEDLRVFLPDVPIQQAIVSLVANKSQAIANAERHFLSILSEVNEVILGQKDPTTLLRQ